MLREGSLRQDLATTLRELIAAGVSAINSANVVVADLDAAIDFLNGSAPNLVPSRYE